MYCVLKLTNQALPPSRTDSPTLLRQIHLKKKQRNFTWVANVKNVILALLLQNY